MVSASAFQVDDLSSILSTYNYSIWTIAIILSARPVVISDIIRTLASFIFLKMIDGG